MTAKEAPQRQARAPTSAVALQGFFGIDTAAREVATEAAQQWREHQSVRMDQPQHDARHEGVPLGRAMRNCRSNSAPSAAVVRPAAAGFAIRTMSSPDPVLGESRNASRSCRLMRFLTTAPPTRRPTASPRRVVTAPPARANSANDPPSTRLPRRIALWKSAELLSLLRAESPTQMLAMTLDAGPGCRRRGPLCLAHTAMACLS